MKEVVREQFEKIKENLALYIFGRKYINNTLHGVYKNFLFTFGPNT